MNTGMTVRVDFIQEENGVWAIVQEVPLLKAFAENRQQALDKLYPAIEEHFRGKVGSVEYRLAQPTLSKARLRELAKKYPPAQSWHEEDLDLI